MNLSLTMSGHLKLDSSEVKYEYRSGASYYGSLKEKKRSGRGVFRWPNGSCYEGHFVDNKRHGEGKQEWPDRSSYVGDFNNDIREGYGRHTWCNDEVDPFIKHSGKTFVKCRIRSRRDYSKTNFGAFFWQLPVEANV